MKNSQERGKRFSILHSRLFIFLRGAVPLLLVALALLAGPTLLVWWLRGGPFGLDDLLIGGSIILVLLVTPGSHCAQLIDMLRLVAHQIGALCLICVHVGLLSITSIHRTQGTLAVQLRHRSARWGFPSGR